MNGRYMQLVLTIIRRALLQLSDELRRSGGVILSGGKILPLTYFGRMKRYIAQEPSLPQPQGLRLERLPLA